MCVKANHMHMRYYVLFATKAQQPHNIATCYPFFSRACKKKLAHAPACMLCNDAATFFGTFFFACATKEITFMQHSFNANPMLSPHQTYIDACSL